MPEYVDRLYVSFVRDFVTNKAVFMGRPVLIPRRIDRDSGKHEKFLHLITENPQGTQGEERRNVDIFRCERLDWIMPMLAEAPGDRVKVWAEDSRGELRYGVALSDFSYVVHLADRRRYVQLITAYCVEYPRRRENFSDLWKRFRVLK
jgi:hypothetical protein